MFLKNKSAFTLVEITIVIALFSIIVIYVFSTMMGIGILRSHVMSKMELEENLHFFVEQLATTIKEGGLIDYEEYWNRQVVGTGTSSGHYTIPTGFGNYGSGGNVTNTTFGSGLYYCASAINGVNTDKMGTGGCLTSLNHYDTSTSAGDQNGVLQRYGQYKRQFWDYNGPNMGDLADGGNTNPNIDTSAIGDEDDTDILNGPGLSNEFLNSHELYLIQDMTDERTFLRWNIRKDPNAPTGVDCVNSVGSGCIGNIQILRLVGKDIGLTHDGSGNTAYDGIIDTWVCHQNWESDCKISIKDINGVEIGKLPMGIDGGWVNIFPEDVDVRDISFSIAPLKNTNFAPAMNPAEIVHPYVRLSLRVGYGWAKRRLLRNIDPEISINTTVSLTDYGIRGYQEEKK